MGVVTTLRVDRDGDVSHARRAARIGAGAVGLDLHDQTRFATAVSEIARNALQYAGGGRVELSITRSGSKTRLLATVSDDGPGIAKLEAVLGGAYQSEQGLGLGIRGARRISDHFRLDTGAGGTVVRLGVDLATTEEVGALARRVADALREAARRNPVDELTEQNRALRDAFARQAFLQRELHHRTKNNLAIIHAYATMQARQVESQEAREALHSLAGRVHALGLVHGFLHHADKEGQIELSDYLNELVQNLQKALAGTRGRIDCDIEALAVDPDRAVEVGIIVNELVTNAIKHARSEAPEGLVVTVGVRREGDSLTVTIADNGRGVADAERAMRNSRSLGWRVVEASARKLNAVVTADGRNGLVVTLTCPLEAPEQVAPPTEPA